MDLKKFVKERPGRAELIKSALKSEFSRSDFDPDGLGITRDMVAAAEGHSYAPPKRYPTKGEHPRVYFNSRQMDGIFAAIENPECRFAVEALFEKANADGDGKLGPRRTNVGKKGEHNYDYEMILDIQAKAFAYAITKHELYGYEAIYMIENYIKTLDIYWMYSDQCREFGLVMFVAACVYDWCYDLLSDEDKFRIIAGVEHRICRGEVEGKHNIGPSSWGCKMEMGFPPYKQGALTGHGAENQLQRDYLSFAIAIFDEYPEWYEFIAGRFYEQYVEVRSHYYTAGIFPQGTGGYNMGRFTSDLYAAILLYAATGENPYKEEDMRRVLYGLIAPVTDIGKNTVFPAGDFYATLVPRLRLGMVPILSSYLFNDGTARAFAKGKGEFSGFGAGLDTLTPATLLIYSSRGTKTEPDPYSKFPLINYNGGWYGQTIARKSFSEDSPISLMKVQCRTTANHDHNAAGTFQIYYKGTLTGDMGDYTGVAYGMTHCVHFMRSTVAHNGILVYNPALKAEKLEYDERGRATNAAAYYYCGAQRRNFGEPKSYESWTSDLYKTGELLAHSEGCGRDGKPLYTYISGDNTSAYDSVTVGYVRRSMLTVFTEDKEAPMVMFVSDRIDSKDESFKKTFLLQNPTVNAPVINEKAKTVEINNGKGKLLLTNILGCDKIEAIGGSDDSIEDEKCRRRNYVVNGEQLHFYMENPGVTPVDGDTWGRVELSTVGEKSTLMTSVMQVADIDASVQHPERISVTAGGRAVLEGARVGKITALFAADKEPLSESFTLDVQEDTDLYVAGVAAGSWQIDGKIYTVSAEEGILITTLTEGKHVFKLK